MATLMRRVTALLVMLMLAALTVGPAAACVQRSKKSCCCDPAPLASLCARSCCAAPPSNHATELPVELMSSVAVAAPVSPVVLATLAPSVAHAAWAASLVSVHERTAPRLPLRV
jgi:hypothetical protein